jgi:hypothetical protein
MAKSSISGANQLNHVKNGLKMFNDIESMDAEALRQLAFFLEGYKAGKGNLAPMGDHSLKALWQAVTLFKAQANINKARKNRENES